MYVTGIGDMQNIAPVPPGFPDFTEGPTGDVALDDFVVWQLFRILSSHRLLDRLPVYLTSLPAIAGNPVLRQLGGIDLIEVLVGRLDAGIDFLTLSPLLGQAFYIGDGVTGGGTFQEFTAPTGATRLFLGIPDGFGFVGTPGAYDDNDGSYRVRIGINGVPTVPEPTILALIGLGLAGIGYRRRRLTA